MEMIDKLLEEIGEDKTQNMSTTSFQFKKDLWKFFSKGYQDKIAVEFGTHKGQTTRILSFLFEKVYTINNNENIEAKKLNQDRNNIEYINFNLYSDQSLPIFKNIDVFLIDAGHTYDNVIMDINRAFSMRNPKECYIVFDDYGCNNHKHTVKRAIDEALSKNFLTKVEEIGHKIGYNFGTGGKGGEDRILEDTEGLITKVNEQN